MSDSSSTAAQYDAMAEEYTADNDDGVFNALYERPAMLSFLEEVDGMRVLDIGCGAGQLSHALIQRNAKVTGIDVSSRMIELAQKRLGNQIDLRVHDLAQPLLSMIRRSTLLLHHSSCTISSIGLQRSAKSVVS